jgi:hypothetical protein
VFLLCRPLGQTLDLLVGKLAAAAGAKAQALQLLRNLVVAVSLSPPRQDQGRSLPVGLVGVRILLADR